MAEKEFQGAYGVKVHTPDPADYHTPDSLRLASQGGRTVADILPPRNKLTATILPMSTPLGGSRAKKYLKVGKVTVDPGIPGEKAIEIDLSKLNNSTISNAFLRAEGDDIRNIAFNTFALLTDREQVHGYDGEYTAGSSVTRDMLVPPGAYIVPQAKSGLHVEREPIEEEVEVLEPEPAPRQVTPTRAMTKMKSTINNARHPEPRPPAVAAPARNFELAQPPAPQAPRYRVAFELDGYGTLEAWYHDIVRGEDGISLILIYDNRYQGGMKYFPPPTDNELFVDVLDLPEVYKVKSTGLRYTVDNKDHCILLIETVAGKGPSDEVPDLTNLDKSMTYDDGIYYAQLIAGRIKPVNMEDGMEKRGYIDKDWTPDTEPEVDKKASSDKVEHLDNDVSKRLAEVVVDKSGVTLRDGCGSEIHMTNGSVKLTTPVVKKDR